MPISNRQLFKEYTIGSLTKADILQLEETDNCGNTTKMFSEYYVALLTRADMLSIKIALEEEYERVLYTDSLKKEVSRVINNIIEKQKIINHVKYENKLNRRSSRQKLLAEDKNGKWS